MRSRLLWAAAALATLAVAGCDKPYAYVVRNDTPNPILVGYHASEDPGGIEVYRVPPHATVRLTLVLGAVLKASSR